MFCSISGSIQLTTKIWFTIYVSHVWIYFTQIHNIIYGFVKLFDLCMACDIKLLFDDNGAGIFDPEDAMAPRTGGVFEGLGDDVDGDPVLGR